MKRNTGYGWGRKLKSSSLTLGLVALCCGASACNLAVSIDGPDGGAGGGAVGGGGGGSGGGSGGGTANGGGGGAANGGGGGTANGGGGGTANGGGGGTASGGGGGTALPARGYAQPWTELQAEDGTYNSSATLLGPNRTKWDATHIEAEAIGRKAVRLNGSGDYVKWTAPVQSNTIVVRYSIPDAPSGGGLTATLGLYVKGVRVKDLPLTSHYSWSYQGGLLDVPANTLNAPGAMPHTFFDEVRLTPADGISISAGDEVKLQRDAQDAQPVVVDLVDFEQVAAPLTMPAGFVDVTTLGIKADDPAGTDYADAVLNAIQSNAKLWFPKGHYKLQKINSQHVGLDNPGHEIRGAGMWYTELDGAKTMFFCTGAVACTFGDFSIRGTSTARNEAALTTAAGYDANNGDGLPQKAFAGPMGVGSLIENVWIEHTVAGIWVGNDPANQQTATDKLIIRGCRIRDTYADGINLDNGTTNSTVQDCHMRSTGDDSVAVWSIKWTDWVKHGHYPAAPATDKDQGVEHGNYVHNVSVQMPWRANCFAVYGGNDNMFEDLSCEDVLTYPGILIDNEFSPYPFGSALTTFKNISLVRAGGEMFFETTSNPWFHGALKFYMREGDVNDILVQDVDIVDPTYAGIEFRGYGTAYTNGESPPADILAAANIAKMSNVTLQRVTVTNAGTYGIQALDGASRGSVNFDTVSVAGSTMGALSKGIAPDAFFNKVAGNSGW